MALKNLKNQNLPKFILFKDLKFKENELELDICCIESAEIIAIADTPNDARKSIPKAKLPKTKTKLELFNLKGEAIEDYVFNDSPYAIMDADPSDIENTPDYDIFDESYTLLWVCPIDDKKILQTLINHTINIAKEKKCEISDTVGLIGDEYIDSISIATEDSKFNTPEFVIRIKQEYQAQLSKLQGSPKQKDWDDLDEMLLK